jgi:hypothetical protein
VVFFFLPFCISSQEEGRRLPLFLFRRVAAGKKKEGGKKE